MSRLASGMIWVLVVGVISATSSPARSTEADPEWRVVCEAPGGAPETARQLIEEGRYAEAEATAREELKRVEQAHGAQSLDAARALDVLVESMWRGGKAAELDSRALAQRAVRIKEAVLGSDHLEVAQSLSTLANLLRVTGDHARARPLDERVLAIQQKALKPIISRIRSHRPL